LRDASLRGMHRPRSEQRQRATEDRFGINEGSYLVEGASGLTFAETHAAQCTKRTLTCVRGVRRVERAVANRVASPENEFVAGAAADVELSAMQGAMMSGTDHDQVVFAVPAAVGTRFDVMNVDEGRVATAGNHATSVVAPHDFATNSWWDRLRRACGRTHVGPVRSCCSRVNRFVSNHVGRLGEAQSALTASRTLREQAR
jgi:hypothetical protein